MLIFKTPKVIGSERLDGLLGFIEAMRGHNFLVLDWSRTELIEPAGFAILSLIVDQAAEKECFIESRNVSSAIRKLIPKFFLNNKKIKTFPIPTDHDLVAKNSFFLCCQGGIDMRYKFLLENNFQHLDSDLRFSIQLVFNELIQNSVDHSTSERYYIYFGVSGDEIHFGVLDMGISLPAKMEQKYDAPNDISYLELSLKEGISTRRQRKGGLGLFHTFEIIKDLEGKFVFISREGQVRRYFAQRKVNRLKLKSRLMGTWVMFTFKNQKVVL